MVGSEEFASPWLEQMMKKKRIKFITAECQYHRSAVDQCFCAERVTLIFGTQLFRRTEPLIVPATNVKWFAGLLVITQKVLDRSNC